MKHLRLSLALLALLILFVVCCSPEPRRRGRLNFDDDDAGQLNDAVSNTQDDAFSGVDGGPLVPSDPVCGNGIFEAGELCDPGITSGPGMCPQSCDDGNACTVGTLTGQASNCTLHCVFEPVTACNSGDGCCPQGCTPAQDTDCRAGCGDGTLSPGESCDWGIESGPGSCPTSCVHPTNACLQGTLDGQPSTCTARCIYSEITQCQSGDGCCPDGCTAQNDSDCSGGCVPLTCAQAGVQCGSASDGCGATINCGGCPSGQACQSGRCLSTGGGAVGDPCAEGEDCATAGCFVGPTWTDGYCSALCETDSECPTGSHCATINSEFRICVKTCTQNSQCRPDGYRCHAPFTQVSDPNLKACAPAATGTGSVGDPCTAVADCGGTLMGSCQLDWPGGYCTEICFPTQLDCPTGSSCDINSLSCRKNCATSADCRSGYSCQSDGFFRTTCQPTAN